MYIILHNLSSIFRYLTFYFLNSFLYKLENRMYYDEQIIQEASIANTYYIYSQIEPSAFFWKELTVNYPNTPVCLVPDTLVLNGKQN